MLAWQASQRILLVCSVQWLLTLLQSLLLLLFRRLVGIVLYWVTPLLIHRLLLA